MPDNKIKEDSFFAISQLNNKIAQFNRSCERELGMGLAQWCLLRKLVDYPACSAQTLAKTVGVHPSSLTQTLKRLRKKAYIIVTVDPSDSRKKMISITRQGKTAIDDRAKLNVVWESDFSSLQNQLVALANEFDIRSHEAIPPNSA